MLLNTQQQEYLDVTDRSGFVVSVHQNSEPAFPLDFGMNVPVGYISSIGIHRVDLGYLAMHFVILMTEFLLE